jgi:Tol biopolymer transport system component
MESNPGVLSGDGRLFATSLEDSIFVFDVASGKQKVKLKNVDGILGHLAFSPDSKTLLASAWGKARQEKLPGGGTRMTHDEHVVTLYDLGAGGPSKRLTFPGEGVDGVAWRPDGKRFAVIVYRPSFCIRFFDVEGRSHGKIDVPQRPWAPSYSPNGRRLIVSLGDTTALVYDVSAK